MQPGRACFALHRSRCSAAATQTLLGRRDSLGSSFNRIACGFNRTGSRFNGFTGGFDSRHGFRRHGFGRSGFRSSHFFLLCAACQSQRNHKCTKHEIGFHREISLGSIELERETKKQQRSGTQLIRKISRRRRKF